MKKWLIALLALVTLTGCGDADSPQGNNMDITVDGRRFVLVCSPRDRFEEAVSLYMMYDITGEYSRQLEVVSNQAHHIQSVENTRDLLEQGIYIQSYRIHSLQTLPEAAYTDPDSPHYYDMVPELTEFYQLSDYRIVLAHYSIISFDGEQESEERSYERCYLVGVEPDGEVRICDFGVRRASQPPAESEA